MLSTVKILLEKIRSPWISRRNHHVILKLCQANKQFVALVQTITVLRCSLFFSFGFVKFILPFFCILLAKGYFSLIYPCTSHENNRFITYLTDLQKKKRLVKSQDMCARTAERTRYLFKCLLKHFVCQCDICIGLRQNVLNNLNSWLFFLPSSPIPSSYSPSCHIPRPPSLSAIYLSFGLSLSFSFIP